MRVHGYVCAVPLEPDDAADAEIRGGQGFDILLQGRGRIN